MVVVIGAVILAVVAASAVFGSRGWVHWRRLQHEQAELEALAAKLERQNLRLEEHLRRLEVDDDYLEKVVRERIGWLRPNEMIYRAGEATPGKPRSRGLGSVPAAGGD